MSESYNTNLDELFGITNHSSQHQDNIMFGTSGAHVAHAGEPLEGCRCEDGAVAAELRQVRGRPGLRAVGRVLPTNDRSARCGREVGGKRMHVHSMCMHVAAPPPRFARYRGGSGKVKPSNPRATCMPALTCLACGTGATVAPVWHYITLHFR